MTYFDLIIDGYWLEVLKFLNDLVVSTKGSPMEKFHLASFERKELGLKLSFSWISGICHQLRVCWNGCGNSCSNLILFMPYNARVFFVPQESSTFYLWQFQLSNWFEVDWNWSCDPFDFDNWCKFMTSLIVWWFWFVWLDLDLCWLFVLVLCLWVDFRWGGNWI